MGILGLGQGWLERHVTSNIQAYCLFAMHFHKVTVLNQGILHMKNLHVVAHVRQEERLHSLYLVNSCVKSVLMHNDYTHMCFMMAGANAITKQEVQQQFHILGKGLPVVLLNVDNHDSKHWGAESGVADILPIVCVFW